MRSCRIPLDCRCHLVNGSTLHLTCSITFLISSISPSLSSLLLLFNCFLLLSLQKSLGSHFFRIVFLGLDSLFFCYLVGWDALTRSWLLNWHPVFLEYAWDFAHGNLQVVFRLVPCRFSLLQNCALLICGVWTTTNVACSCCLWPANMLYHAGLDVEHLNWKSLLFSRRGFLHIKHSGNSRVILSWFSHNEVVSLDRSVQISSACLLAPQPILILLKCLIHTGSRGVLILKDWYSIWLQK